MAAKMSAILSKHGRKQVRFVLSYETIRSVCKRYAVTRRTSLDRYPLEAVDGNDNIEALATVLASFGKHVRYAIGQATDLIDVDSAALFTDISRNTDTWLFAIGEIL